MVTGEWKFDMGFVVEQWSCGGPGRGGVTGEVVGGR